MATIDLIVLGMLKKEPLSAYDIQKLVEYRNISRWVKISTPSIYKKVIQLEEKGYITSVTVKEGKMPEKAVYSLTEAGEKEFESLMLGISAQPVNIFLDFNAVIGKQYQSERKCTRNSRNGNRRFAAAVYLSSGNRNMDCFSEKVGSYCLRIM